MSDTFVSEALGGPLAQGVRHRTVYSSGPTRTSILPVLSPRKRPANAAGTFSIPSTQRLAAFDLPLGHPGHDLAHELPEAWSVVGDDEALQPQALGDDEAQVARARLRLLVVVAGDRAARGDAAERTKRRQGSLELLAANVVEVHVDPVGERLLRPRLPVVECLDAERAKPLDLLV